MKRRCNTVTATFLSWWRVSGKNPKRCADTFWSRIMRPVRKCFLFRQPCWVFVFRRPCTSHGSTFVKISAFWASFLTNPNFLRNPKPSWRIAAMLVGKIWPILSLMIQVQEFVHFPAWHFGLFHFLTAQSSFSVVFCGPHFPLVFHFVCGPPPTGPKTKWKASGRFPFIWLRRHMWPRHTVQIIVFVGGAFWETIVPLGIFHFVCVSRRQDDIIVDATKPHEASKLDFPLDGPIARPKKSFCEQIPFFFVTI